VTVKEFLFVKLMEEAAEIQHATAKLLQFGAEQRWIAEGPTNAEQLRTEINDLLAIVDMLEEARFIPQMARRDLMMAMLEKRCKVEAYRKRSEYLGCVQP
jgi:hypothetical protein